MSRARIIVCERNGQWAAALRRTITASVTSVGPLQLQNYLKRGDNWYSRICETRSLSECWEETERHPASLIVLELTEANAKAVALGLANVVKRFYHCRVVAVMKYSLSEYALLMREAGAVCTVLSPREMETVVAIAQLHFAEQPEPIRDFRALVMAALPWRAKE